MKSLNEKEVIIGEDKREIGRFTVEELIFLFGFNYDGEYIYMIEREKEEPGSAKKDLLYMLNIFYTEGNNKSLDRPGAIAKKLYCKLNLMEDKDVLYIRKNLFGAESFIKTYGLLDFFDRGIVRDETKRLPVKDIVEKKNINVGKCPF
ncbi:hypothetical protein [Clostridium aciditolerans]|uniref:Uncharacterized protein n=1 Tax=Clostridium aciditolerans TaxID=339861 RepID=A0A934HWL1_9CLOT|nr:hypothetical protein [Clostridium aciditolerans]MBI6875600.1 hypothetical protein [Clostridium aciditolerans]